MKHLLLIAFIFVCRVGFAQVEDESKPEFRKLREELLQRVEVDQAVRNDFVTFMAKHADKTSGNVEFSKLPKDDAARFNEVIHKMSSTDEENTQWLKQVIERHGWPTKSMVGKDGAKATWLLVQHADADRDFQRLCLTKMLELPKGVVPAQDIAYLTDRILVGEGKKQKFGTQCVLKNSKYVPSPIEDEEHVDERRTEIGLMPLAEYLDVIEKQYRVDSADTGDAKTVAKDATSTKYEDFIVKGRMIERDDHSFAYASHDETLPGVAMILDPTMTNDVTGDVVDEDENPAADAEVWLSGFYGRIPIRERARTNSKGEFRIAIPIDPALEKIQWSGYAVRGNASSRKWFRGESGATLQLAPGRRLKVHAVSSPSDGADTMPITSFTVHLDDGRIISSDRNGVCSIEGLRPEVQYVAVTSPGFVPYLRMMDFYADRDIDHQVTLSRGGRVIGTVRDEQGVPVPFDAVNGRTCERSAFTIGHVFTDANGRYQLAGVALDKPVLINAFSYSDGRVQYSSDQMVEIKKEAGQLTADFVVNPIKPEEPGPNAPLVALMRANGLNQKPQPGLIRGKVMFPDGKPCTVFRLRIEPTQKVKGAPMAGGFAASYGSIGIDYSLPDGKFIFSGVNVGNTLKATISAPGYLDAVIDPVSPMLEGSFDADEDVIDIQLEPMRSVTLHVVDRHGKPIAGAELKFFRANEKETIYPNQLGSFVARGVTGTNGELSLDQVPISSGRVVVTKEGYASQQFDWSDETLTITLLPSKRLRLKFELDGESEDSYAFFITRQGEGSILYSVDVLKKDPGEWVIDSMLPGVYRLGVGNGPNGGWQFQFAGDEKQTHERILDLTNLDEAEAEITFQLRPFRR